jgi:hypothetical protein
MQKFRQVSTEETKTSKAKDNDEQDQENGGGYIRDEVMSLVEFQMLDIMDSRIRDAIRLEFLDIMISQGRDPISRDRVVPVPLIMENFSFRTEGEVGNQYVLLEFGTAAGCQVEFGNARVEPNFGLSSIVAGDGSHLGDRGVGQVPVIQKLLNNLARIVHRHLAQLTSRCKVLIVQSA